MCWLIIDIQRKLLDTALQVINIVNITQLAYIQCVLYTIIKHHQPHFPLLSRLIDIHLSKPRLAQYPTLFARFLYRSGHPLALHVPIESLSHAAQNSPNLGLLQRA